MKFFLSRESQCPMHLKRLPCSLCGHSIYYCSTIISSTFLSQLNICITTVLKEATRFQKVLHYALIYHEQNGMSEISLTITSVCNSSSSSGTLYMLYCSMKHWAFSRYVSMVDFDHHWARLPYLSLWRPVKYPNYKLLLLFVYILLKSTASLISESLFW
jgi:hypothetical protein